MTIINTGAKKIGRIQDPSKFREIISVAYMIRVVATLSNKFDELGLRMGEKVLTFEVLDNDDRTEDMIKDLIVDTMISFSPPNSPIDKAIGKNIAVRKVEALQSKRVITKGQSVACDYIEENKVDNLYLVNVNYRELERRRFWK